LFILLNIVDVNCLLAGGLCDCGKPPGYAAVSGVLTFFKKHSPEKMD